MSAELENEAQLEIGHVLFMDIVGFSKLLVDEQTDASNRLNQIVRNTEQFGAAEAANKLTRLPTGDGMVLVFHTGPAAPARCAMEIAGALKNESFGLRMGIHSGPVNKISDVKDRSNLAGTGINMAQRVMDVGLGDKDQAFAWLEKAYQERSGIIGWVQIEPHFDPLRSNPRFANLLRAHGI